MLTEIHGPLFVRVSEEYRIDYDELNTSTFPKETITKLNRIELVGGKVRVVSIWSENEVEVEPAVCVEAFKTVRIPVTVLKD